MMRLSRRSLSRWIAAELLAGQSIVKVAERAAAVMLASKQESQVDLLMSDVAWELEKRGETTSAVVTTARPMTDELRKKIKQFIADSTETKRVDIDEKVDPGLLGGVRIETASSSWDKTVRKALNDIREAV